MLGRKNKLQEELLSCFGKIKSESFEFDSIQQYFKRKDNKDAYLVISDRTCLDLDFDELFMFLDRTNSRIGQQYLYQQMRVIPDDSHFSEKRELIIQALSKEIPDRLRLQKILKKLNNTMAYSICSLFQQEHPQMPSWFFLVRLLALMSILSLLLSFFKSVFLFLFFIIFITNLIIHYWNKHILFEYLSSVPQLLKLNKVAKEIVKTNFLKDLSQNIISSIQIIEKVRNRMSFIQLQSKAESDATLVLFISMEFIKITFLLEPLLLYSTIEQLDTQRKEIEKVFTFVGEVDFLISIASLRHGLKEYCIPEIINSAKEFKVQDMVHPLIQSCIPNSIDVHQLSILITGSNMSGKTTFIRSVGINILTAMSLNTCFAKQLRTSRWALTSAIRISDDLMNDKSYYLEEVTTIQNMLTTDVYHCPKLILLDELFKGTNTAERIAAGKAVLSYLNGKNNLVFVSTHDIELAHLLEKEYALYHFEETIDQQAIKFDYLLKKGKSTTRNAIRILELNGYPASLISEALSLAEIISNQSSI